MDTVNQLLRILYEEMGRVESAIKELKELHLTFPIPQRRGCRARKASKARPGKSGR